LSMGRMVTRRFSAWSLVRSSLSIWDGCRLMRDGAYADRRVVK
jgi:hypothetical protein